MDREFFQRLLRRQTLIAVGACLMIAGYVMRSLVRTHRRDHSCRPSPERDPNAPETSDRPDPVDRHLEKYLPRYATACLTTGLILILAGLCR